MEDIKYFQTYFEKNKVQIHRKWYNMMQEGFTYNMLE